ncbi:MAG: preprotein translocase subunit SecG [Candidatus Omnitrophica bacterium]|nr:preprotein translocase subunit SecG [Candidatus Omnitrophota bacterium]
MGFILVIHVIVCILLVIAILMQAGRGGGLTETFQSAESMFGTQTNVFMVRFTTILAVIFLSTSLILAFNSSKVDKSLMANKKLLSTVPKQAAVPKATDEGDVQIKVESPKPMTPAETAIPSKNVPVSPVTNAKK